MKIESVFRYQGHKDSLFALGVQPNTGNIWSGGGDGYIVEWEPLQANGQLICRLPRPVYSFQALPESNQLIAGTASGNMHLIDLSNKMELRNIEAHQLGLFDFSKAGNQLLSAGGDGRLNVWSLENLSLKQSWAGSDKACRVISFNKIDSQIAVGYSDNFIRIYDFSQNGVNQTYEWQAHSNSVFALAYHPVTKHLWSGGRDAILRIWDSDFKELLAIPAHNYHINAISFSPDSKLVATVSMDKTLKIWDAFSFKLLKVVDRFKMEAHTNSVNKVVWLNNEELITAGDDRLIFHWKIS